MFSRTSIGRAMRAWCLPLILLPLAPTRAAPSRAVRAVVETPGDVGRALQSCWHAPDEGDQITFRISFRRDGSVFGRPRVTFSKASSRAPDALARLAASVDDAVAACTPLPVTERFGASIAGRIFLIRFIASRRTITAAR